MKSAPNPRDKPSPLVLRILRLTGFLISKTLWFVRYRGREHLPQSGSGPYVIAANHQTYIDPVWVGLPVKDPLRFMAWDEAFGWNFLGRLIRYLGAFPVSPDVSKSLNAMKEALRSLRAGSVLIVFPEGGREFADGKPLPFMPGAVRIAAQAGVPILPVTITGGNRIWPRGQKYPRLFRRVELTFHPVMHPQKGDDRQNIDEWNERLRQVIVSSLPGE